MSTYYHGVFVVQRPDRYGDVINVAGVDISRFQDGAAHLIWGTGFVPLGTVIEARKLLGPDDCRSDADRGLLDSAGMQPCIRCTVVVADTDVFAGEVAAAVARRQLYLGFAGHVTSREGKMRQKVVAHAVLVTMRYIKGALPLFPGRG